MLRKAPEAGADVIVFDLEDAVAPERKSAAREAVRAVLTDPSFDPDPEVCVRVNPVGAADSSNATDDLEFLLPAAAPDSVMVPKVADAATVERIEALLVEHDLDLPVLPVIESAAGVLDAPAIAETSVTDALVFGAEDLAADLGATRTAEGTEVLYARQRVVVAASAAEVSAIDTVYTDFEDTAGLREETMFAVQLGFDGKLAIHPAQVDPINESFTPDQARIDWATRVLEAREEAAVEGVGVFRVDDEMIDAPLIAQAERIVARARAAGHDIDLEGL